MQELKNNTSYINQDNNFYKALLLKKQEKLNSLLLVESNKELENYKKIFGYINLKFIEINNYSIFLDFLFNKTSGLYIGNINISEKKLENLNQIKYKSLYIKKNDSIEIEDIIKKLNICGYKHSEYENQGTYNKKGDILKIILSNSEKKYNINFWGNTIEEITNQDNITLEELYIGENIEIENIVDNKGQYGMSNFIKNDILVIFDKLNFYKNYENILSYFHSFCSFDYIGNKNLNIIDLEIQNLKIENIGDFKNTISDKNYKIHIYTKSIKAIKEYLNYNNIENINIKESNLNNIKSFVDNKEKEIHITDDIISSIFTRKRLKKNISSDMDLLLKIREGDYVVHIDHGIGIFKQIVVKELSGIKKEYIEIEYLSNDKLFVPITEVSRVNKYLGVENPKLTALNSGTWEKKLEKAKKEINEIALELVELYSKRKIGNGFAFKKFEEKEDIFKDSFDYIYTNDQKEAISEIFEDMEKEKPMDRLLIGDVGFGKTEIAFNAIYKSFINKKQSILISPLVVLAYEHYEKAKDRFKNFGLKIEVITRLETDKKTKEVIKNLKEGNIDLVIGTHKLLNENIVYKDLGLVVIDEEHKFGVDDKEKIKKYKNKIDILSMSATPIPRSLNMALSSIKDMSILKTAPYGRQNIDTQVNRFSESLIQEVGQKEFDRGGQIFFVHNRVGNIENYKTLLQNIFPEKRIVVTHGQLEGTELEKRIIAFKNKKFDILVSTTVIENGIDFPNVNTIIINDSGTFGLSQIHQLRGRVGRSDKKGYCYLLYNKESLNEDTAKRLKTIVEHSYLGAGFELAMKDLEIRGGGDLLGFRQSGQSSQIGINLYLKMIEDKIEELKENMYIDDDKEIKINNIKNLNTKIELNISAGIPDLYFNSEIDKINFYRELETINNIGELNEVILDFITINPDINKDTSNLFDLIKLKLYANNYNIISIKKAGINYQIDFANDNIGNLKKFLELDIEVKFIVNNGERIRTSKKNFENEEKFLQYILLLFEDKIKTIKIKKKNI